MKPSLTRRQIASVLLIPAPVPLAAQPPNDLEQAQQDVAKNRDILAKYALPMAVEPAFQFKA